MLSFELKFTPSYSSAGSSKAVKIETTFQKSQNFILKRLNSPTIVSCNVSYLKSVIEVVKLNYSVRELVLITSIIKQMLENNDDISQIPEILSELNNKSLRGCFCKLKYRNSVAKILPSKWLCLIEEMRVKTTLNQRNEFSFSDVNWIKNCFFFWCSQKALLFSSSGFSRLLLPCFQSDDKITLSRISAYYYKDPESIVGTSFFTLDETFGNLSSYLLKHNNWRNNDGSRNIVVTKISALISNVLLSGKNISANLLQLSKELKLSIKQTFIFCCPELFYQMLLIAGNLLRSNQVSQEFCDCFRLFSDNTFQNFSKSYFGRITSVLKYSAVKGVSSTFLDFIFSFVIFIEFTEYSVFATLINNIYQKLSYALTEYGGLILPQIKGIFDKMMLECIRLEKNHHLASVLYLASRLNIFNELVQNAQIRSKFSIFSALPFYEFLCVSSSCPQLDHANHVLKICTDILLDSMHPFKQLAIFGIHKLHAFAIELKEDLISSKIKNWIKSQNNLVILYPFYVELQNISKFGYDFSDMSLYSSLYLNSDESDNLLDLLLVFISGLLEKMQNFSNPYILRAYEHCLERLYFLAQEQQSKIFKSISTSISVSPSPLNLAEWDSVIDSMIEIKNPSNFSEWIFSVTLKACSHCKALDRDIFRSILPAMVDPFCIIPVLPVLIVTTNKSSFGTFIIEYLKFEIIHLVDSHAYSLEAIISVLDVLNEVFNIYSKSVETLRTSGSELPNWINQFSTDELMILYRNCIKMNILKYGNFFLQLIWSIDSQKICVSDIYETFTKLKDYSSALSISSSDGIFDKEKCVYHFLANRQSNFAESAMNMMNISDANNFDSLYLQNNSLKLDLESFSYNYSVFSRKYPKNISNYFEIAKSAHFEGILNRNSHLFNFNTNLTYESENDRFIHADKFKPTDIIWDNFRLIKEAKLRRKCKDFEYSYCLLSKMTITTDSFWLFKYFLELGNWFHSSGKYNIAIEIYNSLAKEQRTPKLLAKIYRKLAISMSASRFYSDQEIVDIFERASSFDKNCAKTSFELGCFYDSKYSANIDKTGHILKSFARALLNSRKFDHLVYPRFITIWLNSPQNGLVRDKKVTDLIGKFISMSSTSQAVNHLSQIISRVGHLNPSDAALIEQFLLKIFFDFSDISLWKMGSVAHSSNELRKSRVTVVLSKITSRQKDIDIKGFLEFSDLLISICDLSTPPEAMKLNLTKELRACKRIMSNGILIAAPNSVLIYTPENKEEYDYIRGFEDYCIALPSLQRPKKIRFILNNSKYMTALLKPKDDLRKDCRFMELCRFLNTNFANLKTKFCIKIFAVTPLNDECGVIEWVEHTTSFRTILLKSYKKLGISIAIRDLKDILSMQITSFEKFTKFFLPKFPAIFFRWFFERFPSVCRWQESIVVYSNSLAVMSMVGYIIGLGDRHGENILFDETTSSCVHVDFNCLFDKGKSLEYPEKVPFRLTQNLVHAFGAGGINANFKSASSAVMTILWDSKRTILTNLETFLHDPLVEWSKSKKSIKYDSDITNEQATKIMKIVERKLSGYIDFENFSSDGQVDKLIQHATDKKNLSEMYIGWSPFL